MQDCRRSLNEAEQREAAIVANGRKLRDEIKTNLVRLVRLYAGLPLHHLFIRLQTLYYVVAVFMQPGSCCQPL